MGQRIAKHVYLNNLTWEKSTYYVRDAQGNVLATYDKVASSMKVKERDIYGSSRMGMYTKDVEMIGAPAPSATDFKHETGIRYYELSNHLGNVLAVITDRKKPLDSGDYDWSGDGKNDKNDAQSTTADNRVDFYAVQIMSSSDYSPFGVQLDGRNFSSSAYRYGFNGQEKDNELKGEGNSVNYTFRMHDPRLGRFLSVDPLVKELPWNSAYAFAENSVITSIDVEGAEKLDLNVIVNAKGRTYGQATLTISCDYMIVREGPGAVPNNRINPGMFHAQFARGNETRYVLELPTWDKAAVYMQKNRYERWAAKASKGSDKHWRKLEKAGITTFHKLDISYNYNIVEGTTLENADAWRSGDIIGPRIQKKTPGKRFEFSNYTKKSVFLTKNTF